MENITVFEITTFFGEVIEYVKIDRGNDEFTTMTKSHWDELQAQKELGGIL